MSAGFHARLPIVTAAALAMGSTGDKATLTVPFKCQLRRAFVLVEGTDNNATGGVVKFDSRPTAGSDTSRGDGDCGVISKTGGANQQGKYLYEDPTSKVILSEGQQVMVEVTTANGAALAFTAGIIVEHIPEVPANNPNMVAA